MYHTQKCSNETGFVCQCQLNGVKGKPIYRMTPDFYFCADIKHTNGFNVQSKQWHVPFRTVEGIIIDLIFFC